MQSSLTVEFGLGSATAVDTLEIRWPSGIVQTLVGLNVDRRITVPETTQFRFTDVGEASGTNDSGPSYGVAWGDYDNDNDDDLYLTRFGQNVDNRLYRNNGDGTFTDFAAAAGTTGGGLSSNAAWGDYDNDDDLDLYVAREGAPNRLYRNNGDGTFTDVGAASGTNNSGTPYGLAWGDYNNDGDLDLFVANEGASLLYRNMGNGTFTEVGVSSGTSNNGSARGVAWGDYDSDNDLDLYLANFGSANRLYRNEGNGTFTDVGASSGTGDTGAGIGVAWGDYDNDTDLDLYLANFGGGNRLYRNNGDGTFAEVGAPSGTSGGGLCRGVAWGDYDLDGYLDLFVSSDGRDRLYKNNNDGTFIEVAEAYGIDDGALGLGAGWADYDSDGDLDLYLANYEGVNRLYRNDTAVPRGGGNHWLLVDLVGTESNRAGIGARVRCIAGELSAIREISGGSGFLSQSSLTVAFGLGNAPIVQTLEVQWPSGNVQTLENVAVDQRITVTEEGTVSTPEAAPLPQTYALYANTPNPFNPVTAIRFDLPRAGAVQLVVLDVNGRTVRKLVDGLHYEAGQQQVTWDGRNDQGTSVASGVYFYRIVASTFTATRRMVLLK
jgi:hypothetical protein